MLSILTRNSVFDDLIARVPTLGQRESAGFLGEHVLDLSSDFRDDMQTDWALPHLGIQVGPSVCPESSSAKLESGQAGPGRCPSQQPGL